MTTEAKQNSSTDTPQPMTTVHGKQIFNQASQAVKNSEEILKILEPAEKPEESALDLIAQMVEQSLELQLQTQKSQEQILYLLEQICSKAGLPTAPES